MSRWTERALTWTVALVLAVCVYVATDRPEHVPTPEPEPVREPVRELHDAASLLEYVAETVRASAAACEAGP